MNYFLFGKKCKIDEFNYFSKKLFQFNYTTNYPNKFGVKKINNDVGWGCTIRSFQMMLGHSLGNIFSQNEILSLIYKHDGSLSLPKFIEELNKMKYNEGKYLGGYLISKMYINLFKKNNLDMDILVTENNLINIDNLNFNKFTILIFSTRLGITNLNKCYEKLILNCFNSKRFMGIISGVEASSFYFYAKDSKSNIIYLDPHQIKKYNNNLKNINQYLAKKYFKIKINKLNPSVTFCFSYKNYQEFMELKKFLEKYTIFNILNIQDMKIFECKSDNDEWEVVT